MPTLAMGYADGFFRSLGASSTKPGGKVAFAGKLLPRSWGRISMDLVTVDVTDLGDRAPEARRFRRMSSARPHISVDDRPTLHGTIGYELLTSLRQGRYTRRYLQPGDPPADAE